MQHAKNLTMFYCIAGAILNRYHLVIRMQGATAQLAREILERSQIPNIVEVRVEVDNLRMENGQWIRLHQRDVPDFPILDLEYLKDLTVDIYQVRLAPSYIQDKVIRENDDEFQLDNHINEPGFIRVRVYSRFRNATRHQTFISCRSVDIEDIDNVGKC